MGYNAIVYLHLSFVGFCYILLVNIGHVDKYIYECVAMLPLQRTNLLLWWVKRVEKNGNQSLGLRELDRGHYLEEAMRGMRMAISLNVDILL